MIYEKALLNKIEEKVGRIDFATLNVDEVFHKWQAKSFERAPIHVQLIMWSKSNAGKYGYEQNGNSWIRK